LVRADDDRCGLGHDRAKTPPPRVVGLTEEAMGQRRPLASRRRQRFCHRPSVLGTCRTSGFGTREHSFCPKRGIRGRTCSAREPTPERVVEVERRFDYLGQRAMARRIAFHVVDPISSFARGDVHAGRITPWNLLSACVAHPLASEHDFANGRPRCSSRGRSRFSARAFAHVGDSKFGRPADKNASRRPHRARF
jgi:hypothetical protein